MGPISRLSCLYIDTMDLAASVDFYTRCFGLDETGRESGAVALSGADASGHHLVLQTAGRNAIAGIEYEVPSNLKLNALEKTLAAQGVRLEGNRLPFTMVEAVVAVDTDGTPIRIRNAASKESDSAKGKTGRPRYLSHIVVNSPSPTRLTTFYIDNLGFEVVDAYESDFLTFLRCHQPQHHCLGVAPASHAGLNHFAMDCGDIDGLMKSVGRMRRGGHEPIWGPGRHGPGGNIFCYYADPSGLVAEFTCNLIQINDETRWTPRIWARTPENGNVWGTGAPSPRAIELMSGEAAAPARLQK